MGNKMLIDATHPEETRVVVLRGNRVEEFDYEFGVPETASRKYLPCQGDARRAVASGRLRQLWRQPARLPRLQRDPSGLLSAANGRKAGAETRRRARYPSESAAYEEAALRGGPQSQNDEPANGSETSAAEAGLESGSVAHGPVAEYAAPLADEAASVEDIDPSQQTAALEAALPPAKYSADLYDDSGSDQPEIGNWPGARSKPSIRPMTIRVMTKTKMRPRPQVASPSITAAGGMAATAATRPRRRSTSNL